MDRLILETVHFSKTVDGRTVRAHVIVTRDGATFVGADGIETFEFAPDFRQRAIDRALALGYSQTGGRSHT